MFGVSGYKTLRPNRLYEKQANVDTRAFRIITVKPHFMSAPSSQLTQVPSETFWQFVQSNRLAIVHFWASWNGDDFLMQRVLEGIPKIVLKEAAIGQLDVDPPAHQGLCRAHNVLNVPFLAFYRSGRLVRTFTGRPASQVITQRVKEFVDESAV